MGQVIDLPAIDAKTGLVNAVIETAKHARAKIDYDRETGFFKLHDVLPEGLVFPFNFGFVPSTVAGDGDPIDVLVITDAVLPTGSISAIRLLGVIQAEETKDGKANRNDRLVSVPAGDPASSSLSAIGDMRPELLGQIERFFESYGDFKGKRWKTLGRGGPDLALRAIEQAIEDWEKASGKNGASRPRALNEKRTNR